LNRIDEFVEVLRAELGQRGQLVHLERIPPRPAVFGELEAPLRPELADSLVRRGIERLYVHQTEAINAVRKGEHVAIVTGTASGKTLCYNIPVLESLLEDPRGRALYIFPTKALAQDQLGKLRDFEIAIPPKAATYDGDTPIAERRAIKTAAQIVLTNPDMLHVGILPYHTTWARFFRNLKYVVIDEFHGYRGVFGSHVADIIRRLRRVCAYYQSDPRFICASATIANPKELVSQLTGLDVRVISNDGSPSGEKIFVFWNPPLIAATGERRSPSSEAAAIFAQLIREGIRTIVFTQTRKQAELILAYTKAQLLERNAHLAERITAYRAGYRPQDRREIERRLFGGELLGVTSTTALEVGVDIGDLDAAVLTGYPGSIASTWQQAGRAGRGQEKSLAVLIAMDNPLDQFLIRQPSYFFGESPESAVVDPENPYILAQHAVCAAYEIPLSTEEAGLFGEGLYEVLAALGEAGQLDYRGGRWYWAGGGYPAKRVSIRSASSDSYEIVDLTEQPQVLGTVDASTAFMTVHPGAIYLHAGESYVVERLDVPGRKAYITRADVSYYTTPLVTSELLVDAEVLQKPFCGGEAHFGDVRVTEQVVGYTKHRLFSEAVISHHDLNLPAQEFETEGVWITIPQHISDRLVGRGFDLAGTVHAVEHAAIGILPLFAMCDRQDVGGLSSPMHPDLGGLAGIFVYDSYPGGVGIARTAYTRLEEIFVATLEAIRNCPCDDGCPSCVQSPKCGNNNEPLDKLGAIFLLDELLAACHPPGSSV